MHSRCRGCGIPPPFHSQAVDADKVARPFFEVYDGEATQNSIRSSVHLKAAPIRMSAVPLKHSVA